jgi:simple sugar transport system substrate-binding protein/ribose transport system substrate-binding protein
MKKNYPGIKVFGEATNWDGAVAAQKLQTDLTAHPDIKGVYMQSSFALSGTLQVLKQRGLLVDPKNKKHVFVVSNDGIPEELKSIAAGKIDATVSQPADAYAKYALYYLKAAIDGKKFKPGKTDHDSTIIQVRDGLLEDQLSAPLVTADGGTYGGVPSVKSDDKSLWGNNLG